MEALALLIELEAGRIYEVALLGRWRSREDHLRAVMVTHSSPRWSEVV